MYRLVGKRMLDVIGAITLIIALSPIFLIVIILVRFNLGKPIIFKQIRPGKNEKLFYMYKFRTMTDEVDDEGRLLSDDIRLTKFGEFLRKTSLDELPELFNILKGDMSFIGPRPQLVEDMCFMTKEERKRHLVKQGLTGLAQINGRNEILWPQKIEYDLKYMENITLKNDVCIFLKTIIKVFKKEGISSKGTKTSYNYGDYLLIAKKINKSEYDSKKEMAQNIIKEFEKKNKWKN